MSDLDEILRANQERIDGMHRCVPGRTALLVVDMQRGFLEPGAALDPRLDPRFVTEHEKTHLGPAASRDVGPPQHAFRGVIAAHCIQRNRELGAHRESPAFRIRRGSGAYTVSLGSTTCRPRYIPLTRST